MEAVGIRANRFYTPLERPPPGLLSVGDYPRLFIFYSCGGRLGGREVGVGMNS